MLFQRWLSTELASITDGEHRSVLQRFATWNELRRLRRKAEQVPLTPATIRASRERIRQAATFLSWITAAGHDLATCPQERIDTWLGEHQATRKRTIAFLRWATQAKLMPRRRLSAPPLPSAATLPQREHHDLISTLLTTDQWPLRERLIALLVLLYAQPLNRITRLTYTDITTTSTEVFIRLGDPPAPVPPPLDGMLRQFLEHRGAYRGPNANTDWLFPGRTPGQPVSPHSLAHRFSKLGMPIQLSRTTALRQLLLTTPSPVVATMLTYHPDTTARIAIEEGSNWNRYVRPTPTTPKS
jgi:hypothetical protein